MEFTSEELDMLTFVYHKGMTKLAEQRCPFHECNSIDKYDYLVSSLPNEGPPKHVKDPEALLKLGIKLLKRM